MPHPVSLLALEDFDSLFPENGMMNHGNARVTNGLTLPKPTKRYVRVTQKKLSGVTYTPRLLAQFVARQILEIATLPGNRPVRVLDPAVGHGELLSCVLALLPGPTEVFGFETDAAALEVATSRLAQAYPNAALHLAEGNFLDHVTGDVPGGLFERNNTYDIIIANPPYVRTQIIGADRAQALAAQFGLTGRVDLSFAFLLGMARVLASTGTAGMIVSNRFMTTRAGSAIREALLRELSVRSIFDLGDTKVFDAAVLPAVIIANGRDRAAGVQPVHFTTIYEAKSKLALGCVDNAIAALEHTGAVGLTDGRVFEVEHGTLYRNGGVSDVWRMASKNINAWLETVAKNTWANFGDVGKVRVGVKTCADQVFIRRQWPEPLELLRPLTTHRIARRFRADSHADATQIVYPHHVLNGRRAPVDLDHYPISRAYLETHRKTLEARTYVTQAGRRWYELWVPQNPADWEGPKLVFRDICEQPTFWIDDDNTVVNGDCYWLKPKPGMVEALWLALAVGNSTFIERFYDLRFNNKLYSGRRRFITQYVDAFPLPALASPIAQKIVALTKRLYASIGAGDTAVLEQELDNLVWQSFGVSREEV